MAPPQKAGLQAFASSYYDASTAPGFGNPFNPNRGTGASGLSQLQSQLVDQKIQDEVEIKSLEAALLGGFDKAPETGPRVLFNPSTNQMFVNGALYNADDKQSALDAEARGFLDKPRANQPEGSNWQTVSPESYKTFMNNIENPGLGTLMARNFEIGGSNLKLLAGRGMQFLGAEETGQNIVNNAVEELYYNQPFQREFTEIDYGSDESHGAIDWFVANLAQQGPNLIESIAVALVGAGAGAVAGGGANPFTAAGGAIYNLLGKESVKKSIIKASEKYMKGQALTKGEKKVLREFSGLTAAAKIKDPKAFIVTPGGTAMTGKQFLKKEASDALAAGALKARGKARTQAIAGGAAIGSIGGSYAMGVADIYGEVRDTGVGNRATAALGAIPYAALETLPEFFLAGRIFGLGPDAIASGSKLKQFGKGFTVGGTLEGLTELGQEGILLASTNQLGDAEVTKRLINSFAAGFAIGGPLGGGANLLKKGEPTNVLNKEDPDADKGMGGTGGPIVPTDPGLTGEVLGPEGPPPQEQIPNTTAALPPPPPPITRVDDAPDFVAGQEGVRAGNPLDTPVQVNTPILPGQAEGQQGIMFPTENVGDPITAGELNQLSEAPVAAEPEVTPQATQAELEAAGQQTLNLPPPPPAGQQLLLENANNVIAEQQNQLAVLEKDRQETEQRIQNQREFDATQQIILNQRIERLENTARQQLETENRRLNQELEDSKARERAMVNVPVQQPREPRQLNIPGILKKGRPRKVPIIEPDVVTEPTREEMETTGVGGITQIPLPLTRTPAKELRPVVDAMRAQQVPEETIQEYVDDFESAITLGVEALEMRDQGALTADQADAIRLKNTQEAQQIMSEMKSIVESNDRPRGQQTLQRREEDAVQEQSPEGVDVQEQTRDSQEVRRRDTQEQETTGENRLQKQVREASIRQTEATTKEERRALRELEQDARRQQIQESDARISTVYVSTEGKTPIELWNELKPKGSLAIDRLPTEIRQTWNALVADGKVNGDVARELNYRAFRILGGITGRPGGRGGALTAQEEMDELIGGFEDTTDYSLNGEAQMRAEILMDIAFFATQADVVGQREAAIEYINRANYDTVLPIKIRILRQAFVKVGNTQKELYGTGSKKEPSNINNPWLNYAVTNNLLKEITTPTLISMPSWFKTKQQKQIDEAVAEATEGQAFGQEEADKVFDRLRQIIASGQRADFEAFRQSYEAILGPRGRKAAADKIEQLQIENSNQLEDIINSHLQQYTDPKSGRQSYNPVNEIRSDANTDRAIQKMNKLFANANPNHLLADGTALKDYFDNAGSLKTKRLFNGRIVPDSAPEAQPGDQVRSRRTADNKNDSTPDILNEADSKDTEGKFKRADGKPADPMGKGEIELIVKQVLKKLKIKPTVTVVANVQELARTNPALYARAKAGRPLDDFDTVQAVGYSIGDQVIIFSDYAKDKQQIRTVIAHEALGHFGFRAFMPRSRMNALFREIYRTDGHVKAAADAMMTSNPNMDLLEAVEEVLADRAGALDVRMIDRLKNIIQAVLDVVGLGDWLTVGDPDLTRYFLSQSRRNLRTGGRGVVGAQQLAFNLKQLQSESEYGRFQIEETRADHATNFFQADGLNRRAGAFGGFNGVNELLRKISKGKGKKASRFLAEVAEKVQTLDNKAQRSEGLSDIFKIFQKQAGKTRRYMSEYERLTAFTHTPSWFGAGKGPTKQELEQAGDMLAYGHLRTRNKITTARITAMKNLMQGAESGARVINEDVRQQLEEMGKISREEFEQGFTVVDSRGREIPKTFTVTDNTWRIYSENRAAIAQAAVDEVKAHIEAIHSQKMQAIENFKDFVGEGGARPTSENIQIFKRIVEEYSNLYMEGAVDGQPLEESTAKAQTFIREINRALHDSRKVEDWLNGKEATAQFQGDRYTDIIASLRELNQLQFEKETAFKLTNAIQNIFILDQRAVTVDFNARRTLATGYVPFTRRGKWQVRMQAYDTKTGEPINLEESYAGAVPFFQAQEESDAQDIATELKGITAITENAGTKNETTRPIIYTVRDKNGNPRQVEFKAQISKARQSQPLANSMNLTEFMNIVQRLDIGLTPTEREKIFTAMTKADSTARKSLIKTGNPGWDRDVVRSIAEHLETRAHVAGKVTFSWQLNDIMADNFKFRGDPRKLKTLEEATTQGTEAQREEARKAYDAYAYQYSHMADIGAVEAKDRDGNAIPNQGRGEDYRQEANNLMSFYSEADNIQDSTDDVLSGEATSKLKLAAVLLQLGGSIATAIVNLVSLQTHAVPYLATYNPKRGYGGGFGFGKAAAAVARATNNIFNSNLANYEHMVEVANDKQLQNKYGLSPDEANAMLNATGAGVLQAAQFNALVGTSRGGRDSNTYNGAIKTWMFMFSFTEQLNRRATFLAAYRLEMERMLATIGTNLDNLPEAERKELQLRAEEFATKSVNTSQGEYAMYNRPGIARKGLAQYIFMYKQFVIISVQLMKGLPPKGRLAMLGMLFVMAGMKGLPFADDIMDLIDTLAQKFGIKMKSVEEETARLVDAFIPGASPVFMRGWLDQWTGATFSTRLGFADLIPLTGMFKAKSNAGEHWREAENFAGPVFSGVSGLMGTAAQLVRYGAEAVGLKDDTTRFRDILRDSPSAAIRGLADGMTYLSDGKITRADGTVLDNEVGVMTSVFRMMGFYPYQVMVQNDIIRMTKQTQAYAQDMKAHYKQAYVKARLEKNRGEMRRIMKFVKEHNKDVGPRSEFYFKDFIGSANKTYNSAKENSLNRFRKFAPKQMRPVVDQMKEIYGID